MQSDVSQVLQSYPPAARKRITALRKTILEVAKSIEGVGLLEETLKWGEPSYLTSASRSGTTVRIAWQARDPEVCSVFVNCQTNLVDTYRSLFPELQCIGNRQVRLPLDQPVPDSLRDCFAMALTYKKPRLLEQARQSQKETDHD